MKMMKEIISPVIRAIKRREIVPELGIGLQGSNPCPSPKNEKEQNMEKKEGQFALFKNKNKQAETHADWQGQVSIGGKGYWVNAWTKTTKNGEKYLSGSLREKQAGTPTNKPEVKQDTAYKAAKEGWGTSNQSDPFDDKIPF